MLTFTPITLKYMSARGNWSTQRDPTHANSTPKRPQASRGFKSRTLFLCQSLCLPPKQQCSPTLAQNDEEDTRIILFIFWSLHLSIIHQTPLKHHNVDHEVNYTQYTAESCLLELRHTTCTANTRKEDRTEGPNCAIPTGTNSSDSVKNYLTFQ